MKIGLIQSEAVAGDLSYNLRRIVQGYRKCLDGGADLTVAPAQALDGALLRDLAWRSSLRLQALAALRALASETSLPLLLTSWAGLPEEAPEPRLRLLERGDVRVLPLRCELNLCGKRFFIDAGESPTPPPAHLRCDYVLHLPTAPWWLGQREAWRAQLAHEAQATGARVLLLRPVACAEGEVMPGGSLALTPRGRALELPHFAATSRVWNPSARYAPAPQKPLGDRLLELLRFALSHTLRLSSCRAFAVADDSELAPLLRELARLAVGARRVLPTAPGVAQHDAVLTLSARSLVQLRLSPTPPSFPPAQLAPLGELYDSELAALSAALLPQLPPSRREAIPPLPAPLPTQDERHLRLMLEENAAPAEILAHDPTADEARLRRLLRLLSSAPRHALPPTLRIRRRIVHLPAHHRLQE